ncbi:MAG: sigma-70 family RNA polymerase sigma factor [Armatimonadetes bacterium]|nr:sigma-70 family RNA polymerase sigma factor [Armatimonadota bacterium]
MAATTSIGDAAGEPAREPLRKFLESPSQERLTEAYREYAPYCFKVAKRITQNEDAADQIVLDIFIALLERRFNPLGTEHAESYLHRLVAWRAEDWRKKRAGARRAEAESARRKSRHDWIVARVDLEDTLRLLPPTDRTACRLRYLFGYTIKEIAAREGVSQSSVERRIRRGLAALRRLFNAGVVGNSGLGTQRTRRPSSGSG